MRAPTDPKSGSKPPEAKAFGSHISALHVIVVLLSLAMTVTAWQYSKFQSEKRTEQRFEIARDRVVGLIKDRMARYEDALWAGASAIESHGGDVTLDHWRIFAKNLRIEERYPGINGIGVIHFLSDDMVADYLVARRAERPAFRMHPAHDEDIYLPISFIEPEAVNAAAVGLDVAHEVNRRTAALKSRDSGEAQISGPIVLVQDAGATAGFLFYAPFYDNGLVTTKADRERRIIGAVYAPFVVRKLMSGLLAKDLRNVSIRISDGGEAIYDEHLNAEALHDPDPMFVEHVTLSLYGREWHLDVRSNLAFRHDNSHSQPYVILLGGLLIEVLIISLLITMSRANRKAVTYADDVTKELRIQHGKLVTANNELEQFAYATSHDLKTPIRGIGGLTEMLKEDLGAYLKSDGANPDVAMSLDLIQDRVQRMNDLTSGIIEFSRIGAWSHDEQPLNLSDMIASLVSDFGLDADQLTGDLQVETVDVDPINCRRVLENLISNAIKYHDGERPLCIVVASRDCGRALELSVADNGPGIAPEYRNRIFGMFQTLRVGDAPESTGIGLAIVKKATELHGGGVRIQSSVGQGATFCFDWPKGNPAQDDVAQMAAE